VNKFCAGHYNGYITEKGNVIAAFHSVGSTVPTLRLEQASEIFTRQIHPTSNRKHSKNEH
jgi:hypothetical protein